MQEITDESAKYKTHQGLNRKEEYPKQSLSQPKPTTPTETLPPPLLSNTPSSKNSSLARTLLLAPQKPPQPPPPSQAADQGIKKFQICPKTKSVLATMLFSTKALRKWILLCLWSKECANWKNQKI